jgi:hypothetical protein
MLHYKSSLASVENVILVWIHPVSRTIFLENRQALGWVPRCFGRWKYVHRMVSCSIFMVILVLGPGVQQVPSQYEVLVVRLVSSWYVFKIIVL